MTHVLFWDIDGTLLSTARAGVIALQDAADQVCGVRPDLDDLRTAGLTDAQIAALVVDICGIPPTREHVHDLLRSYEAHLPKRLPLRQGHVMAGVPEILADLETRPGVDSLLLTGNTRAGARAKLRHYGLIDHFDDGAFCGDADDRDAIARRAWEMAVERSDNGLRPEHAFVIGDTAHDVRCARSIDVRPVAVASGPAPIDELRDAEPWLLLERLPEPARFAELLGLPGRGRR